MSDQKLPQKMKKKSNKLKDEDKEKCNTYYLEVNKFIEKNETVVSKKTNEIDYFFEYDKTNNFFTSDHYDNKNLEAYGYYNKKEKKIYLSVEEAFYLNQTGLIAFKEEFDFNNLNLIKLNLYSYLRRSSKIPLVCKLLLLIDEIKNKDKKNDNKDKKNEKNNNNEIENIDNYFILFETLDDFKNHKIKSILYQHDSNEKINYNLFKKIINNSQKIYKIFNNLNDINDDSNDSFPEIVICVTQGISITFLKLDDKIEI